MKKIIKTLIIISIFLILLVFTFVPFVDSSDDFHYCRYRFAVYECWVCDSEGEGCNSDFSFLNVELGKKIGGPLEYFGFKELENDTLQK